MEVLVPAFRAATSVRGAFGWFTAQWIANVGPGLAEFLAGDERNTLTFTIAPFLFPREQGAVKTASRMGRDEASRRIAEILLAAREDKADWVRYASDCLTWLLAADRLRLRVAVPHPESNYHPKIWLFSDGADEVVARGSGNATGLGVAGGIEHMDVDVSWESENLTRLDQLKVMLQEFESGRSKGLLETCPLPEAIRRNLIRAAPAKPPTPPSLPFSPESMDHSRTPPEGVKAPPPKLRIPDSLNWTSGSYGYQKRAVVAWEETFAKDKGCRGILSMATGTGKTKTALICAARLQDKAPSNRLFLVVSCPSKPLIKQWVEELQEFGIRAYAPSIDRGNTTTILSRLVSHAQQEGVTAVVLSNRSFTDQAIQNTLRLASVKKGGASFLISDEVHSIGTERFLNAPPDFFEYRLGLSATPVRQYDDEGTDGLFGYYGECCFEIGIGDAIGISLVPYDYHIHVVSLSDGELQEIEQLNTQIARAFARSEDARDDHLQRLLIQRRRILETAEEKLSAFARLIGRLSRQSVTGSITFTSAKNPYQFDEACRIVGEAGFTWAGVTTKTTPTHRELTSALSTFQTGAVEMLIAKKVLDEGVDLPSVRAAFFLASSAVEREWIQRRGRILRKGPGKDSAVLHDFFALPPIDAIGSGTGSLRRLVRRQLLRAQHMARHAKNYSNADGPREVLERLETTYLKD